MSSAVLRLQAAGEPIALLLELRRGADIYFDYFRNLHMECPPEELVAPLRLPLPERSSGRREPRLCDRGEMLASFTSAIACALGPGSDRRRDQAWFSGFAADLARPPLAPRSVGRRVLTATWCRPRSARPEGPARRPEE